MKPPRLHHCLRLSIAALLALWWPWRADAQRLPANARLPLEHWSMPFLEHLVRRGALIDPTPMMRPWQVRQIVQALHDADTSALSRPERGTLRKVLADLDFSSENPSYIAGVGGGLAVSSYSRRPEFELRETGPSRVTPDVQVMLGFQFGPGLLMVDGRWIQDLEEDPDFGGAVGFWQLKSDATYGLFKTRYVDLELGALDRNWGPTGFPGLLVSNWPLAYDHLFMDFGPPRLHLSMLATQLDEAANDSGQLVRRFFVAHRLAASPTARLHLALWQGTVFSGENRSFDLGFLNPMQFTNISRTQRRVDSNIMLGGDAELRAGRFILAGSVFGDDFDFHASQPFSFALTTTAATSVGSASIWLGYTLVSRLAYHSSTIADNPLIGINPATGRFGTGLARNFCDYDQLTLRASMIPLPGLIATPEVTWLRQGEGDLREPPTTDYSTVPGFLQGTIERTLRMALALTFRPLPGASINLSGGVHQVWNADHVVGAHRTRAVGAITARYLFQFGGAVPP